MGSRSRWTNIVEVSRAYLNRSDEVKKIQIADGECWPTYWRLGSIVRGLFRRREMKPFSPGPAVAGGLETGTLNLGSVALMTPIPSIAGFSRSGSYPIVWEGGGTRTTNG